MSSRTKVRYRILQKISRSEAMIQRLHGKDKVGLLRGLAAAKGFDVEQAPTRDTWLLLELATGKLAETHLGATGFTVDKAIAYLKKRPDRS